MNTITITLPLPDSSMSGHAKGNWHSKAATTKRMRRDAHVEALHITQGERRFERAVVSLAFYLGSNRRRDALNLANGVKPYIDGLVDAGLMPDDDWKVMSVGAITCKLDKDAPRVEITISEKQQ